MADQKPPEPGTLYTHEPLPYVIRLRITLTEDSIPEYKDVRCDAYSVWEAVMQASFLSGVMSLDGAKIRIEDVRPDTEEYNKRFMKFVHTLASSFSGALAKS